MKLDVLQSPAKPWYADGLTFTCTQCGNCCTGGPGYVWISDEELGRLATHLNESVDDVREKYCRSVSGQVSLKERKTLQGLYDCVFLKEVRTTGRDGRPAVQRVCGIYEVRPLQCRTWPFWEGNLASRENWDAASTRCHGMNAGRRQFSFEQIEKLRTAKDWPKNPPTSAGGGREQK
jgi:Fe-S-cluster containining protein